MAYLKTKKQLISVEGKEIAYRELGKGNSKLPLVMLVHLEQPWIIGILN